MLLGKDLAITVTTTKCAMGHARTQSLQTFVQSEGGMCDNTHGVIITYCDISTHPSEQKNLCFAYLLLEPLV